MSGGGTEALTWALNGVFAPQHAPQSVATLMPAPEALSGPQAQTLPPVMLPTTVMPPVVEQPLKVRASKFPPTENAEVTGATVLTMSLRSTTRSLARAGSVPGKIPMAVAQM